MKKSYFHSTAIGQKKFNYPFILSSVLLVFFLVSIFSCEKGEKVLTKTAEVTISPNEIPGTTISNGFTKVQALSKINKLFEGELKPVRLEQVQGVNRQQFIDWLRKSKLAAAETQYLSPLLASDVSEIILLNKVIVESTTSEANYALVVVPPSLYSKYTRVIVLSDYTPAGIGKVCFWFYCDRLDPNMTLCLGRTGIIPPSSPCPASQCGPGQPCSGSNIEQVIVDAISTF
jgi:hypothetical protein